MKPSRKLAKAKGKAEAPQWLGQAKPHQLVLTPECKTRKIPLKEPITESIKAWAIVTELSSYFQFSIFVWLYFFCICILVCFLTRNISIEEDVSCESAWNKLQKPLIPFHSIWGLCRYKYLFKRFCLILLFPAWQQACHQRWTRFFPNNGLHAKKECAYICACRYVSSVFPGVKLQHLDILWR